MAINISDVEPRVQYTATSGQTSFTVGFEFFTNTDLKVFNGSSLLSFAASPSDATEYSVTGAGVTGGGSITLGGSGATLNDIITISRDLAISRTTDFPTSGAFQIASLNEELDKIIAMCQQLERDLKFSPKAAATTSNTFDITFPNLVANKVLSVNSSGNGLEFSQNITDITTIAGIASDITTVSGIASNVTTVAGAVTNINTVASNITNINTVATNIADIITVANDLNEAVSEIETVASDLQEASPEIDTVATNITNVNSVGNNISNVNSVASISANVTTVAGISANVTTVAGITSNIALVASNEANVNLVGGSIANVNLTGGSIANVNTVATNLTAVNSFANQYRIASSAPVSSLDVGDLYFDTTANELKVYKSSGWAAAGSTVNGTSQRYTYTISGTPTTVSGADANGNTLAYDSGYADVYVNGVRMSAADITITSGTSVVFAAALANADVVDIVAYGTFNVASVNAANIDAGTLNIARIADDSITNAKLDNNSITINGSSVNLGGSVTIATETRPTVSSVSPSTITNSATNVTITGQNFVSIPQVEALNPSTGIWYQANSITFTNATTIVANFTLTVDASYKIMVTNPDTGNSGISGSAILTVSDAPTWSTAAGSIGSFAGNFSGTLATLAGSSDSTVSFTETTSNLTGAGVTLNSSTGALTTSDFGASSTTPTQYNFTVRLQDAEGQYVDRSFSMTSTFGATGSGGFN